MAQTDSSFGVACAMIVRLAYLDDRLDSQIRGPESRMKPEFKQTGCLNCDVSF